MSARLLWFLCFIAQVGIVAFVIAFHVPPWGLVVPCAMALFSLVMAAVGDR